MSEDEPSGRSPPAPSALAARAQLGDRRALEQLLRQLSPPLLAHVRAIVHDDDVAADVLQDTLLIVCRRLGSIRQTEWVRAWAYRIATREAVRAARRARRDAGNPLDDAAEIPTPTVDGAGPHDDDLLAQLPARLTALPAGAQIVLRLHYLQSLTQEEVAEALEIPLGTVKSRLAYGLNCLRKTWVP